MICVWLSVMCCSSIDDLTEYYVGYTHKKPCSKSTLSKQQEMEVSPKAPPPTHY